MGTCHLDGDELALTPQPLQCFMYIGYPNWTAYDFSFQLRTNAPSDNRGVRIQLDQTRFNFCLLWLGRNTNSEMELSSRIDNQFVRLAGVGGRLEPDRWYEIKIEVRGSDIRAFLDGRQLIEGGDKRLTHGRIGLGVFDSSIRFRDMVVKAPDGAVLWQGPPDISRLSPAEIDRPNSVPPVDMRKTSLLGGVDLPGDALAGLWTRSGEDLRGQGPGAQIQFPFQPPDEYDYRVSFVRFNGNGAIGLIAAQHGNPFEWIFGGQGGTVTGAGNVGSEPYDNNETTRHAANWLPNGVVHTLVVRVRRDWVLAYLDGSFMGRVSGEYNKFTLPADVRAPSATQPLGIRLESDAVIVKSVDVFALSQRTAATEPGEK
jgi:hypothetical protein